MKILFNPASPARRRNQRGYIVIALLVILSILLIYIMVNVRYLRDLNRELRLFEREQIKRLQKTAAKPTAWAPVTNILSGETIVGTKP